MATKNLAQNILRVNERIGEAAERAGRPAESVKLVAVTKYVDADVVRALASLGCHRMGESRPQELWRKDAALDDVGELEWHMIGHLQRNKIRRTLSIGRLHLIHSVDRMELVEALSRECRQSGRSIDLLLEIHIAQEEAKHGWKPEDAERAAEAVLRADGLRLRGLMGMASLVEDRAQIRREFESLRALRDQLAQRLDMADRLTELSMGMSRDFELAIEAGATFVRIGSILYEDRS